MQTEKTKEIKVLSFEDSLKILRSIKATILEKATDELNKPIKFIYAYSNSLKMNSFNMKGYSVNYDIAKIVITFRRAYLETQFIKIVGLNSQTLNKILIAIKEENLIQEFNIWFKDTLKANKESLLN